MLQKSLHFLPERCRFSSTYHAYNATPAAAAAGLAAQ